jgi:hypothetical protein
MGGFPFPYILRFPTSKNINFLNNYPIDPRLKNSNSNMRTDPKPTQIRLSFHKPLA